MPNPFDFFLLQHDLRFVALAALICLVSAFACVSLLRHANRAHGPMQWIWIGFGATAVGLGIWATHFVSMLAFRPGFSLNYDLALTGVSLLIAVVLGCLGIAMTTRGQGLADQFLGGAVVGIAISAMHYTGIAALVMGGEIGWNVPLIALSVLAGMVLGGLAFVAAMRRRRLLGAVLLTLAICGMHFTAMGAADFSQCFPIRADGQLSNELLSVGVAIMSLLVLGAALGSIVLDAADRRRTAREKARERADAARLKELSTLLELATTHMLQGLCLFNASGRLEYYNERAAKLVGNLLSKGDKHQLHFHDLALALQGNDESTSPEERAELEARIDGMLTSIGKGETLDYMRTMHDGRIIRFIHNPTVDGGWVTTIDDVTSEQRSQAAVAHLAFHDSLTNVLNRTAFNEQLDQALTTAETSDLNFAVLAIDLDRFKEINDTYGHVVGDEVLKGLAMRLSAAVRDGEIIARVGGDEFAALKMFSNVESLREFVGRIEAALFSTFDAGGITITGAASIGVAIYPDDGDERSRLLNNADLAMYRAKNDFDRHVCYYEAEMDEHARARRAMAKDLWTALAENQFHLVYQVQKSVATDEVTGYEVLLRWNRPGYGAVGPADFIPVAEECGAIGAIGNWVLRRACMDAASWPDKYRIAVNISGVQVSQIELIDTVRDTLMLTGLAPSRLELEVTETAIIADKARALHVLRQIKAMGVAIAIDDFGTGYSSLDTLRSFPFDKIKIDRSFMTEVDLNEQSKAIVRAILALGRSLSIPVLAEGVETEAQLDVLRAEGCNEAQGYLLGRPKAINWHANDKPRQKVKA
ncbi:bifunctional diguanylate cyclase/phosphodiesterase [Devosia aquimaris]|uniref:bifunctional diguanylate cyclase/phosphodiesterase n=1 Tax=Devosia aquimaris TaxID=2866214 RepID=UPI001CD14CA5|nr:bifunctional diguanylate cyclase/phosphodiesterase [Devosia sp. CJK-A8-3]